MRWPTELVEHVRQRLARVLAGGRAKHRAGRVGQAVAAALARLRSGRVGQAVAAALARLRSGRLGRAVAAALARLRSGRLGQAVAAALARLRSGRLGQAVAAALAKHPRERLGRTTVVALVLLLGLGTAGALALLPPDRRSATAEQGGSGGAAPSRIAIGYLAGPDPEPRRPGPAYYRRTTSKHVAASAEAGFMPLYRRAAESFGVSWRLLASIHRQETAFSSVPSTYHGLNAFGCCAGPMQFNVTNGPPSTWALYRNSFRRGDRPRRYPHPTRHHPSIYDDFDAIMAAAALLRDGGAGVALDGGAWAAAYAYYGHDRFGTVYASQVVGRAQTWERDGFCLNCTEDASLVAALDDAYGVDARRVLRAAEKDDKHKKKKHKKHKKSEADREAERAHKEAARARRDARRGDSEREAQRTAPPPPPAPAPAPADPATSAPPTTPTTTTEAPPAPPPPPACTGLKRLLGCGG